MLEIAAIYWLWNKIGDLLRKAGRKPMGYQLSAVFFWFAAEFIGAIIGYLSSNPNPPTSTPSFSFLAYVGGLAGATFAGFFFYFLVRSIAENKYPGLTVLAALEFIVWVISVISGIKWISSGLWHFYPPLPNIHTAISIGAIVVVLPFVIYGFVQLSYQLGYVLGLSISAFIVLNTILMHYLAPYYRFETSLTKLIFPGVIVVLLLTRYRGAFRKQPDVPPDDSAKTA